MFAFFRCCLQMGHGLISPYFLLLTGIVTSITSGITGACNVVLCTFAVHTLITPSGNWSNVIPPCLLLIYFAKLIITNLNWKYRVQISIMLFRCLKALTPSLRSGRMYLVYRYIKIPQYFKCHYYHVPRIGLSL